MTDTFTLYGMTASLYTGKVRAYMRYNSIPFREIKAGSAQFAKTVKPAVGRWIVPVIETPEGDYVQDGSVILDYFEQNGHSIKSIYPEDPRLIVLAHLFELFGGEGLLRPAMHYRWNFDDTNLNFLKVSFEDVIRDGLSPAEYEEAFLFSSGLMRKATQLFGVSSDTQKTIEESYAEFLSLFSAHLKDHPFLLGAYPTIGDYGLFGPLWAHLGRDPKPLHLMQISAPRVHRWTEKMNMSEHYVDELSVNAGSDLISGDAIPETLRALMRFISEEYLPEIVAHVAFTNQWLSDNPNLEETFNPKNRMIGKATFSWRSHELTTSVMTYRFFLLQRLQDAFDKLSTAHQSQMRRLFAETGLEELLDRRTTKRVIRKNHLEVWHQE